MATTKQQLGEFGERLVAKMCPCPGCKRDHTLKRLPPNFKCANLICDFCGFLAQVKASTSVDGQTLPKVVLGAAWGPQKERMDAAIYFPLYLVLVTSDQKKYSIHYLSADLQPPELFAMRKPLSSAAKRAGWQGFNYNVHLVSNRFVRIVEFNGPRES